MDFDRLIEMHKDSVYRQLVRACGNREDAEDALVESLVVAWQASDRLEHPEAFRSWVGTIAGRVCMHLRRNNRLREVLGDEGLEEIVAGADEPQKEVEMGQLKGCIAEAVSVLEPDYREVYVRREIEGQSTQEVADNLGLSEAAVKSRLHRARERVREALDASVCGRVDPL